MPADWSGSGVAAVDHDLDGWMDLVVTGAGAGDETLVALNLQDAALWGRRFQLLEDLSGWLTKPDGLPVYGMAVADFDGDRVPDLALAGDVTDPAKSLAAWVARRSARPPSRCPRPGSRRRGPIGSGAPLEAPRSGIRSPSTPQRNNPLIAEKLVRSVATTLPMSWISTLWNVAVGHSRMSH